MVAGLSEVPDDIAAWNNFVMNSDPDACAAGSEFRAAAIANLFMGLANNGGINHFLTASYDLDVREVNWALDLVGAHAAADQLLKVIERLGLALPVMTQDARWTALKAWPDELDGLETLAVGADIELVRVLGDHVAAHRAHYLALTGG